MSRVLNLGRMDVGVNKVAKQLVIHAMAPASDEQEELILSARYGDIDDIKLFVDAHGADALADARDESGNSVLHMTCANGHQGLSVHIRDIIII